MMELEYKPGRQDVWAGGCVKEVSRFADGNGKREDDERASE